MSLLDLIKKSAETQTKARPPFDPRSVYVCTRPYLGTTCGYIFWSEPAPTCPRCGAAHRPADPDSTTSGAA